MNSIILRIYKVPLTELAIQRRSQRDSLEVDLQTMKWWEWNPT